MQVEGSVYPEKMRIMNYEQGIANVLLRRDITEETIINEDGNEDIIYKYEETKISLVNRENLETYIENNFDNLFEQGLIKENTPDEPTVEERFEALENALLESAGI